ncbi:site-specific integrase [Clostridium sp. YIM B02569]|uniref:site-specific integrase n=1 Tax=Clostridium sp. YIM B02569 TaxID=2911967 RepID=UPI001EED7C1C|nr:site-specific integrase [Clostridium sp. YIM B02569]
MIKMNRKHIDKTFDECFQQFLLEHCTLKNMREDTKKYYIKEYIEYLPVDCPYLFPIVQGEKMKERGLTREIEDYNKSRGIERTSIHAFRHWYAKKAVMNGINIVQLQHLLGHSNLEILKHYVEMLTEDLNYENVVQNPLIY